MNSSDHQLLEEVKTLFPNFTCTLQDLRNPTEEFVTNFYMFWLQEFEVNIGAIPQLQFSQHTENVSRYQDSYTSVIPKLNLLKAIRAFNVVPDFGMLDIVSPTPRRIQTIVRAFLDFYQFSDNRIASMIDMKKHKKINERKQTLVELMQEKEDLQEEQKSVLIKIGQLQDTKKMLEGEVVKYKQLASELRVEKELLKTQTEEANDKIKKKEAALQKLIKEDTQVTEKMKEYSSQIVNSPTMILSDLETFRAKEEEMKNLSDQKRDLVESKMKIQAELKEVLDSADKNSHQLDEVLKVIEHYKKLVQIVSDLEKSTVGCQEELEELKSSLMSIVNKKSNRQEELQALTLKWKTVKDQLTQSLEAAKIELNTQNSVKSKMITGLKANASIKQEIDSIMAKIVAHNQAFEQEKQRILSEDEKFYEALKSTAEEQMKSMTQEVEEKTRGKKSKNKNKKWK